MGRTRSHCRPSSEVRLGRWHYHDHHPFLTTVSAWPRALKSSDPPLTTTPDWHLPLETSTVARHGPISVSALLMQNHPLPTPAVSSCFRSRTPPMHSSSAHPGLSREQAPMLGPQTTGLCTGSGYAKIAPWTRHIRVWVRTFNPPLGASKRRAYLAMPSREGWRAALAATLPAVLSARWKRGNSTSQASSSASTRIERAPPRSIRSGALRATRENENRRNSKAWPADLRPRTSAFALASNSRSRASAAPSRHSRDSDDSSVPGNRSQHRVPFRHDSRDHLPSLLRSRRSSSVSALRRFLQRLQLPHV